MKNRPIETNFTDTGYISSSRPTIVTPNQPAAPITERPASTDESDSAWMAALFVLVLALLAGVAYAGYWQIQKNNAASVTAASSDTSGAGR